MIAIAVSNVVAIAPWKFNGSRVVNYTKSYHAAINHLIAFGAHGGNTNGGRVLIARALRDLKEKHGT